MDVELVEQDQEAVKSPRLGAAVEPKQSYCNQFCSQRILVAFAFAGVICVFFIGYYAGLHSARTFALQPKAKGVCTGFTVSIIQPSSPLADAECKSPFFQDFKQELRKTSAYVDDPANASLLFIDFDNLRQCLWPAYGNNCKQLATSNVSCFYFPKSITGDQLFLDSIKHHVSLRNRASRNAMCQQVFVYMANVNSWSGPERGMDRLKRDASIRDMPVFYVGLDLIQSKLDESTDINLLMPLLPDKIKLLQDSGVPLGHSRCDPSRREVLASFVGARSTVIREQIYALNDNTSIVCQATSGLGANGGMFDLLQRSKFGFAPRGDNHYSFRLTETMAAGAIPILVDDEYSAPYTLHNIRTWAVVIPESKISQAPAVLRSINDYEYCLMHQEGQRILQYALDMKTTVAGMLYGLSRLHRSLVIPELLS